MEILYREDGRFTMKTVSSANSAALAETSFAGQSVWTARRLATVAAAIVVLIICWQVDGVRLSTIFNRATADAFGEAPPRGGFFSLSLFFFFFFFFFFLCYV